MSAVTKTPRLENAILFFAKNGGIDVGKKKLAKLLYFADFTAYEASEKPITEVGYTKMQYGPMPEPKTFYSVLLDMKKANLIEMDPNEDAALHGIIALAEPQMDIFDESETKLMQAIAETYKNNFGGQLEKIAQSEAPYIMADSKKQIPYHFAFYRNTFGQMNLGDESN